MLNLYMLNLWMLDNFERANLRHGELVYCYGWAKVTMYTVFRMKK